MRRLALVLASVCFAAPALADRIDGDWCFPDGRHFTIDGPKITTATGQRLNGDSRRHFFSYVVPPPDAKAGAVVQMALADEETVHLSVGSEGPTETWKRCSPTS
jgi:hypothetical protein